MPVNITTINAKTQKVARIAQLSEFFLGEFK